mgnify:CR=1 FL=1
MPRRYDPASEAVPAFHLRLGTALIASLRNGYSARDLRADLLAVPLLLIPNAAAAATTPTPSR